MSAIKLFEAVFTIKEFFTGTAEKRAAKPTISQGKFTPPYMAQMVQHNGKQMQQYMPTPAYLQQPMYNGYGMRYPTPGYAAPANTTPPFPRPSNTPPSDPQLESSKAQKSSEYFPIFHNHIYLTPIVKFVERNLICVLHCFCIKIRFVVKFNIYFIQNKAESYHQDL